MESNLKKGEGGQYKGPYSECYTWNFVDINYGFIIILLGFLL